MNHFERWVAAVHLAFTQLLNAARKTTGVINNTNSFTNFSAANLNTEIEQIAHSQS